MIARALGTAGVVVVAFVLVACGDDERASGPDVSAPSAETRVAELLPDAIASKGTLTVATSADYAPVAFVDEDGRITGLDPELARAIGAKLGLDTEVVNAGFEGILAGLDAGKYDIVVSGVNDTRQREERYDFVTYFTAGTALYALAETARGIGGLDDLCGRRVGVARGTIQQTYAADQDRTCEEGGASGVAVQVFPDQNAVTLALRSGRVEVAMADSPVAAHVARRSDGDLVVAGDIFASAPYGIAVPKGSGLAEPLRAAVDALIRDGTYAEILQEHGLESGALDRAAVNAATD